MKGSSATSARAATAAPRPTGPSSGKPRPTPTSAEQFTLSGPSNPPDPDYNAYRKDLADVALAARVIASHYAEALERVIAVTAALHGAPADDSLVIRDLAPGEGFAVLDDSLGWAWGYAGPDHRVGYVRSESLSPR